jgi:hypothetical protein
MISIPFSLAEARRWWFTPKLTIRKLTPQEIQVTELPAALSRNRELAHERSKPRMHMKMRQSFCAFLCIIAGIDAEA